MKHENVSARNRGPHHRSVELGDMMCIYQLYVGAEIEVGLRWKNRNGDGKKVEKIRIKEKKKIRRGKKGEQNL